ncbi:hypothetical protein [Jatrophihabitans sp.]|uniref:hypothetical protein n=1 Tax=Jatrophihabitans sp. TaxID=1932789 RepID=UPI002F12EB40
MVNERDPDAGTEHWLDLGPDPDLDSDPRHPGGWRWWSLLVAAMAVAALLLTQNQRATHPLPGTDPAGASVTRSASVAARPLPESHSPPRRTGSPLSGQSLSGMLFGASPAPTAVEPAGAQASAVSVTDLGHPLLAVPAGWELFGQGPGIVVRIELGRGRVTRTSVPEVGSASPIFFVVGHDRAIVHPMDSVPGYVVRDGKPATQLPPALDQAASALPGPDPWHLWAETETGTATALSLLTLDGRPAGVQVPIPKDATVQASDRAGNVLMFGIGGMYDLRQDGMHRITGGTLLAVGPTRWLTLECDESYRCDSVVIDRATGARQTVKASLDAYEQNAGAISPDGRTAALLQPNGIGASTVHLLDLSTGADRLTGVTTSSDQTLGGRTFVWSPDSRWLFVTNGAGRVLAIDRAGRAISLDVHVGAIDQLALRTTRR